MQRLVLSHFFAIAEQALIGFNHFEERTFHQVFKRQKVSFSNDDSKNEFPKDNLPVLNINLWLNLHKVSISFFNENSYFL